MENAGREGEEVERIAGEVRRCFEILVPRVGGGLKEKGGKEEEDDDDGIDWEDGEAEGGGGGGAAAGRSENARANEANARRLVGAMGADAVEFDLGGPKEKRRELKEGALSGGAAGPKLGRRNEEDAADREGGGGASVDDAADGEEDGDSDEKKEAEVFEALRETLAGSLASLRNQHFPKIKAWMAALEETRTLEESSVATLESARVLQTLRTLVVAKSKVAESLGMAERFKETHGHLKLKRGKRGEGEAPVPTLSIRLGR